MDVVRLFSGGVRGELGVSVRDGVGSGVDNGVGDRVGAAVGCIIGDVVGLGAGGEVRFLNQWRGRWRSQPCAFELGVVRGARIRAGLGLGDVVGGGWMLGSGTRSAVGSARVLATV